MADNFQGTFKAEVCKACGYCGDDLTEPSFCSIVYSGDKDRFLTIVQYLIHMRRHERKKFKGMYNTFEGFCGLWCNSKPACPNKSENCQDIVTVMSCFTEFVRQNESEVTQEVKESIYESFSGIEMAKIGLKYKAKPSDRKDIRKKIKSLKKRVSNIISAHICAIKGAVAELVIHKESETTFFFRDSPKWVEEIENILGEKLTDNDKTGNEDRQSDTSD